LKHWGGGKSSKKGGKEKTHTKQKKKLIKREERGGKTILTVKRGITVGKKGTEGYKRASLRLKKKLGGPCKIKEDKQCVPILQNVSPRGKKGKK